VNLRGVSLFREVRLDVAVDVGHSIREGVELNI
jgi:hypothetical protein